jgi:hypothetical protein
LFAFGFLRMDKHAVMGYNEKEIHMEYWGQRHESGAIAGPL